LSALPRYLPAADVERLIDASSGASPGEIRDKAILLLLARLGLRAHDVMAMELDDVAWTEGLLLVQGKSRREVRLPLPQEVGDALLVYIEEVRPLVDETKVFLRSMAPYRPFGTSSVISGIVRRGLERAGITNPPSLCARVGRRRAPAKRALTFSAIPPPPRCCAPAQPWKRSVPCYGIDPSTAPRITPKRMCRRSS
jgi:integrase